MAAEPGPRLTTARLVLRPWCDRDMEPYVALCADRQVMRYFPWTMGREDSEASMARYRSHFAGVVGLSTVRSETHFTPAVEVAWRLFPGFQGRGYATEAARASVAFGFQRAGLEEIVAFCTPDNRASRRVMEKLGMTRDPADDFDHPAVAEDHPMRRVVLYRLQAADWAADR